MKLLNHTVEANLRARCKITNFKIHRRRHSPVRHLVWWRLSLQYGPTQFCEECEADIGLQDTYCDACHEHHFCECGQRLEDAWGTPGDGFCARCR